MKVTPIILLLFYLTLTLCQRNGAEFPEMVDFYGYPSETHEVTTSDGYILTIFRIPSGREDQSGDGNSQPVLVMHGIPASSDSMIVNGADGSFSFVLADNSYDVWLINLRGNYYSRNHETLDPENDEEFWDYNLLDNVQDAMATVEYILAETGFEQLIMVGVSHGSTVTLISLATEPEWFAERVSLFVGHVPISRLGGMTNPYFNLLTDDTTIELFGFLGLTEILSLNYLQSVAMDVVCIPLPGLWERFNTVFVDYDPEVDNYESYDRMQHHMPAGTNVNTIRHYSQFRYQDRFMYYDYGEEENVEVYGTEEVPDIPLDQIQVPVALITASRDSFSITSNTEWLADNIPTLVESISYPFDHMSFLVSNDHSPISELIRIIEENTE